MLNKPVASNQKVLSISSAFLLADWAGADTWDRACGATDILNMGAAPAAPPSGCCGVIWMLVTGWTAPPLELP